VNSHLAGKIDVHLRSAFKVEENKKFDENY